MIDCSKTENYYHEKAVKIVQEWSNAHPQETYLSEFLRYYPNVSLDEDGTPTRLCPHNLGLKDIPCENVCSACWNQSID